MGNMDCVETCLGRRFDRELSVAYTVTVCYHIPYYLLPCVKANKQTEKKGGGGLGLGSVGASVIPRVGERETSGR